MNNGFITYLNAELDNNKILKVHYMYSNNEFFCFIKKDKEKSIIVNILNGIEFNILKRKILLFSIESENCETYEKFIKKNYSEYKSEIYYYRPIYKNDCIVRFYPNYDKFLGNFDLYKKVLYKKYFKVLKQSVSEEDYITYSLDYLGIYIKNLNCTDSVFISSLHKKWEFLVFNYYNIFLKFLENNEILDNLDEEEINEYMEELNEFKTNKQINLFFEELRNNKKTVKEIISFWPDWMRPKPDFVHDI